MWDCYHWILLTAHPLCLHIDLRLSVFTCQNLIIQGDNFVCSTYHLLCLARPPLRLLPRPPGNRPPSIQELYSKQKTLTVGPKQQHWQHNKKTTSTVTTSPLKAVVFYPHIPRPQSQLDKMNTSLRPAPLIIFFLFSIFVLPSVLRWCSLQQGACCTDE